ncbi:MAG: cobalamin biosynthesis protein [Chloroflexi bacterium]|nr:cobalamin biosynthesis protein [Chloroflexota bacterium]
MEVAAIIVLALAIDVCLGEPPEIVHPVVWMGKATSMLERLAPTEGANAQRLYGTIMVLLTVLAFVMPVYFLLRYVSGIGSVVYVIAGGLLLKPSFSFAALRKAALEIELLLSTGKMEGARTKMPVLVSRDVDRLGKGLMVSATLESVAENSCDSVVAPLFFFLLLGVPGAVAYRVVNTMDGMIGYHGKYEYLGKFAAKLDDLLNFIPARISGLLMVAAAYLCGRNGRDAWRIMHRDHRKTESPNAGWPMSAVAGALEVRLEKEGCYRLGNPINTLSPVAIKRGVILVTVSALLWVLCCSIMEATFLVFAS